MPATRGRNEEPEVPNVDKKVSKKGRDGKEADSITLPSWPSLAQLPRWKTQALSNILQAANRVDEKLVREWVLEVEKKGSTAKKLQGCPE